MPGRGAWLRNKQTHDQRDWPAVEAPSKKPDTNWIAEWYSVSDGLTKGTVLTVNSIIVLFLGADSDAREVRLRELSKRGFLHMAIQRDEFYRFERFIWVVV